MKLTKLKVAAGLLILAAVTGGSAAYAIPGGAGAIHGCYNKNSGALRVTDPATNKPKACGKSENALNWATQGDGTPLTANVANGGFLEGGTALSVEHPYIGSYNVTFDRDVSMCTPIATLGSWNGGSTMNLAVAKAATGTWGPNVIGMTFHIPDAKTITKMVDTDFHLAVFC